MEGELLEGRGESGAATRLYAALAAREPWNPWPLLRLGRIAIAGGDAGGAERWAGAVLDLVPESADARWLETEAGRIRARERPFPPANGVRAASDHRPRRAFQSYPPPHSAERGERPC